MDEKQREFLRHLCKQSLFDFVQSIIVPTIPRSERLQLSHQVHLPALNFIQDDSIKRKGLLMPRSFLKSTTITKSKPIWDYINNPEERIAIVNEIDTNAKKFLGFIIHQLRYNSLLHYVFPETLTTARWQHEHRFSIKSGVDMPRAGSYDEPTFYSLGVGGASQGWHFTRIYLDDIIGKKAMRSVIVRADTRAWFDNVKELLVYQDLRHRNASFLYVIGTHWAPGDIYMQIQSDYSEYEWMKIQALNDEGQPTWPEKLSLEQIEEWKADPADRLIFYTQYQNNPQDTELTDFKYDWLQFYERIEIDGKPAIRFLQKNLDGTTRMRQCLISELDIKATIDPAFREDNLGQTARTAIAIVGVHPETNFKFILEAWAKRVSEPRHLYEKVMEFHLKYRPRRWGCEAFQAQAFVLKGIREYFIDHDAYIPISELPKDVSKDAKLLRIRSLLDWFPLGRIYIRKDMKDFIDEYLSFPMGTTMDLMDALAYQVAWWSTSTKESIDRDYKKRKSRFMLEMGGRRTGY